MTAAATRPPADVETRLKLDIVLGQLLPRERLVEDELMARYGAKRHAIRGALAELARLGLVERQPHRGAAVRAFTAGEVAEIYAFRSLLHRLAVEGMGLPFPAEAVDELRALSRAHRDALAADDLTGVVRANDRFHGRLFAECGNRFLAEAIRRMDAVSAPIRSFRAADRELTEQAAREHDEMVALAASGDRAGLARLCEAHIQPSRALYLETVGRARRGSEPG